MTDLNLILDQIKEGARVVLVVGAGLSKNPVRKNGKGLFDWPELAAAMVAKLKNYPKSVNIADLDTALRNEDYQKIADDFKSVTGGTKIYKAFLKQHLDPDDLCGSALHKLILKVGFRGIITTNFDCVFESCGKKLNVVKYPGSLREHGNLDEGYLYKIHGCIKTDTPEDDLILASEDYEKATRDELYMHKLKTIAEFSMLLCVGYSFSDPDFELLTRYFKELYDRTRWPPYILMKKDLIREKPDDKVKYIPYEDHDRLWGIMEQIRDAIKQKPESRIHATEVESEAGSLSSNIETTPIFNINYPPFEIPVGLVFEAAKKEWLDATSHENMPGLAAAISRISQMANDTGQSGSTGRKDSSPGSLSATESKAVQLETLYYFITSEIKKKGRASTIKRDLGNARGSISARNYVKKRSRQ